MAEIDPEVVAVAKRFFGFRPDTLTSVTVQDGRRFLVTTRNTYDAIIVDAYYAGVDTVPRDDTGVHAGAETAAEPGGVAIFNVIGSLAGENSKLVRSEDKTIRQVFRSCAYFPILQPGEQPSDYSRRPVRNVILVASEATAGPPRYGAARRN